MIGVCSNFVLVLVNLCLLILSVPFFLTGWIMKAITSSSPCEPVFYQPLYFIGTFLVLLSVAGILGSCCRYTVFMWFYLGVILLLIIVLVFLLVFGAVFVSSGEEVENNNNNNKVMVEAEYKLQDFPSWLRHRLVDDRHWDNVQNCIILHDGCGKLQAYRSYRSIVDFIKMERSKLSPMEIGCCKPPASCGFVSENATSWRAPDQKNGPMNSSSDDPDCKVWNNRQDLLCYKCSSCKASYIALFVEYWNELASYNLVALLVLIIILIVGYFAVR